MQCCCSCLLFGGLTTMLLLLPAATLNAAALLEGLPSERPPLLTLLADVSRLVMADLAAAGQAPDEQVFLQLARIAGISGDADKVRCGGCVAAC